MSEVEGLNLASKAATTLGRVGSARPLASQVVALAGTAGLFFGGCADSFMDPTVSGRWEHTPTIMPILSRIAAIEDEGGDMVELSDPVPEDLIPLAVTYRLGPGDQIEVTLFDLIVQNQPETYEAAVDSRGYIELPQIGRVFVSGRTTEQATEAIKDAMRKLVADPLVLVVAKAQRQQTFNIIGAIDSPGPYFIPKADYRLLEALTSGGRFDETVEEVYVIRQVPLSDEMLGTGAPDAALTNPVGEPAKPTDNLIDIIDELAPQRPTAPPPEQPPPTPASTPKPEKPAAPAPPPPIPLPGDDAQPGMMAEGRRQPNNQPVKAPAVDLPETQSPSPAPRRAERTESGSAWVFLNGKWIQVSSATAAAEPSAQDAGTQALITQRVIRVPLEPLLAGRQSYNIIIRPGDVIRVPPPPNGLVYITGQVARPGPYQIPTAGGLTLLRAIDSAGGYSTIAIPWRLDVTRMIGRDRQATIRMDGRAIAEQTQPDVFLRPNDRINVGSNFWALPLAIVRGGFRATYGYGFILDRNLANDLFGPPPVNQFGQ